MSIKLKGKEVIQKLKDNILLEVENLASKNIIPTIAIIQVGNKPEDISYRNSIVKKFNSMKVKTEIYSYETEISMEEFMKNLEQINQNEEIQGILLFRPLPKHLDYEIIKTHINPEKDIDCMNPYNLEKIFEGNISGFVPCTPKAVMEILKYYQISLEGSNVAIVNRSMVVGKPLAMMLLSENATITICNSKTKNLAEITSNADIVIAAVGKPLIFGKEYFNENSIVIDVGINFKDGRICGDVDYDNVKDYVKAITPVPGGVGGVTTLILLHNLIMACKGKEN
ncbi:bifunctional 5,10-methylenetetrahydrofolate dehydrogenase/5,10-methenyltetrahydrofolate cyclohydrolase [Haloimpatiens sp. FM7330]|uniref:bifunctional 5,10-methylenetetrahydrofolate dehydrogenase/5,10-methenyltetrahydrofolate cyclohydrolase n=1 Tax=Haloimpatiens sp. FM7330 TaxID=3298610 RepID=UPI00362AE4DD